MKPLFCNYFLTFKCDLCCDFCPAWRHFEEFPEEAPLEVTLKNLEILSRAGIKFLNFSGGDPFLYEGFSEVLKKAKELKLITAVSTSGLHYPDLAGACEKKIDFLCFDLNSHTSTGQTEIGGFNYFDQIVASIKLAKKMRELVFIKFVVHRDNVLYLQEMVELAVSLGVPLVLRPACQNNDLAGFEKQTFNYIKRYFSHPAVFLNSALFDFLKDIQNKKVNPGKFCQAGQQIITVLPSGELAYPCFYRRAYAVKLNIEENYFHFLSGFPRKETGREIPACSICRDWDYFEPSFFYRLNRYNWFNIYSWVNFYLKKTFSPYFGSS